MRGPAVSVVVPSLGRPRELDRCLTALGQLRYRPYEIVVVACAAGRHAAERHAARPWLRSIPNRETGVAEARNDGIAAAAGEIVAFIDDDAVPEPMWLEGLVGAMMSAAAPAATGDVLGRNGISPQWRCRAIDRSGFISPRDPSRPVIPMLEGTNMAIRRTVLARMGGFDPAYRFYMDDADMAVRLFDAGLPVAFAPDAQVHHGFAASARRRPDRMPTDLHDVGRSLAVFLRKHLGPDKAPDALHPHRANERRRLLRYMLSGHAEPRDVRRLLGQFDAGAVEGLGADLGDSPTIGVAPDGVFREDAPGRPRVFAGRPWAQRALRRQAADAAQSGESPSLFLFSPTALYHRVRYVPDGYWEQTGGLFGRSTRSDPAFRLSSFGDRLQREIARVAKQRGLPETQT